MRRLAVAVNLGALIYLGIGLARNGFPKDPDPLAWAAITFWVSVPLVNLIALWRVGPRPAVPTGDDR